jgi:hypothetical protein
MALISAYLSKLLTNFDQIQNSTHETHVLMKETQSGESATYSRWQPLLLSYSFNLPHLGHLLIDLDHI